MGPPSGWTGRATPRRPMRQHPHSSKPLWSPRRRVRRMHRPRCSRTWKWDVIARRPSRASTWPASRPPAPRSSPGGRRPAGRWRSRRTGRGSDGRPLTRPASGSSCRTSRSRPGIIWSRSAPPRPRVRSGDRSRVSPSASARAKRSRSSSWRSLMRRARCCRRQRRARSAGHHLRTALASMHRSLRWSQGGQRHPGRPSLHRPGQVLRGARPSPGSNRVRASRGWLRHTRRSCPDRPFSKRPLVGWPRWVPSRPGLSPRPNRGRGSRRLARGSRPHAWPRPHRPGPRFRRRLPGRRIR